MLGVLPRDFTFVRNDASAPPQQVDAYIPFFDQNLAAVNPQSGVYAGLIRVRPWFGPGAVAAAVDAAGRVINARDFGGRGLRLYPVGLKADTISRIQPALVALGAAGMVLVFMLMVNLASVLLARVSQREHELAVSRALGANTAAILRSTLLEGGMLGFAGGVLGALVASWGTEALVALAPLDLPRREAIAIDWRIAAAVITVGSLLGILGAAAPAVWAARTSLSSLLAGSSVRGGGGQSRWRRGMIVAQVALSFVLLSSGALVVRSFERCCGGSGLPAGRRVYRKVADGPGILPQAGRCDRFSGSCARCAGFDSGRSCGGRGFRAAPYRHGGFFEFPSVDHGARGTRKHRRCRARQADRSTGSVFAPAISKPWVSGCSPAAASPSYARLALPRL